MKSQTLWMVSLACCLGIGACGGGRGVERGVAQKACEHQIGLGFWQGYEKSFKAKGVELDAAAREEGAMELEKLRADPEYKAQLEKCTDGFAKLATQANIDCVLAAKAPADAQACLKP